MKKIILTCFIFFLTACGEPAKTYTPIDNDAVILAFGDSLTYGTGTSKEFSYTAVLARLTGHKVINAGIPGEVSKTGLKRLPKILDKHQPELLILIHGGNDILRKKPFHEAANNLKYMINMAKDKGIKVVMLGVPTFRFLSLESAKFYEEVASETGVPIDLEILPKVISNKDLKSDRIHPNQKGYKLMAEAVHQLLVESGAISQ